MGWFHKKEPVSGASEPERAKEDVDERKRSRVKEAISALTDEFSERESSLKKDLLGGTDFAREAVSKLDGLIRSIATKIEVKESLGGDFEVTEWLEGKRTEYQSLRGMLVYEHGLNPAWEELKRDVKRCCGEDGADRRIILPPKETIPGLLLNLQARISEIRSGSVGDAFIEEERLVDATLRSMGADAMADVIKKGNQ